MRGRLVGGDILTYIRGIKSNVRPIPQARLLDIESRDMIFVVVLEIWVGCGAMSAHVGQTARPTSALQFWSVFTQELQLQILQRQARVLSVYVVAVKCIAAVKCIPGVKCIVAPHVNCIV
jgi:hypothetical protein